MSKWIEFKSWGEFVEYMNQCHGVENWSWEKGRWGTKGYEFWCESNGVDIGGGYGEVHGRVDFKRP